MFFVFICIYFVLKYILQSDNSVDDEKNDNNINNNDDENKTEDKMVKMNKLLLNRRRYSTISTENELNKGESINGEKCAIIDNGSGIMKYGYGNELKPSTFLTLIGNNKYEKNGGDNLLIGDKAIKNEKFISNLHSPIKNGIIENYDEMEKIWWYIFKNKLNIDPSSLEDNCNMIIMYNVGPTIYSHSVVYIMYYCLQL